MSRAWLLLGALLTLPLVMPHPAMAFQSSASPISTTQTFSQPLDGPPIKVWEAMQRVNSHDPRVEVLENNQQQLTLRFRVFTQGRRPFSESTADADITAKLEAEPYNKTLMLLSVTTLEHVASANSGVRTVRMRDMPAGYAKIFIRRVKKALLP